MLIFPAFRIIQGTSLKPEWPASAEFRNFGKTPGYAETNQSWLVCVNPSESYMSPVAWDQ